MRTRSIALALVAGVALAAGALRAQTPAYDLIIRNGRIVDGTGSPWYRADLAIRGDTIARIAARIDAPATRVVDVAGNVVAPGFIDPHTHARRGIFDVPTADNYVRQGVTTIFEGPDGSSPGAWAASTPRTCETKRRTSSTACARRSRSARRADCRRRSRITRLSGKRIGEKASRRCG